MVQQDEVITYFEAAEQLLAQTKSNLPARTLEAQSFGNWRWQWWKDETDPIPAQHVELWQAIDDFTNKDIPFLLLYGVPGVGKTHLARAIGWQRVQGYGAMVLMYQTDVILDMLRTSYEKGGYADLLERLQKCDLLILDDLGAQAVSDWGMAKLDSMVDYRYADWRQTIITTNNLDRVPPRVLDRCREGRVVMVKGKSQRGRPGVI